MKKIFLLVLPFVFLFSNCRKNDDFLFEMEYINDFTITAGLNPFSGTHIFETDDISSMSAAIFNSNGKSAEEIVAINPGIAVMRGIFSSPSNGYIREVSIKIFSKDDPTFEREVFYNDQIPVNASGNIGLIGTLIDAKDFLVKDDFGIRVELQLRDISPETVDMRLDFSFYAK